MNTLRYIHKEKLHKKEAHAQTQTHNGNQCLEVPEIIQINENLSGETCVCDCAHVCDISKHVLEV